MGRFLEDSTASQLRFVMRRLRERERLISVNESQPILAIIMSSLSDYEIVKPGVDLIESWGVPYEIVVASAQRTPERVAQWAATAELRGLQVIIAASGMAAHLPAAVTARTQLPVIGIPVETGPLQGTNSLYSIVQMPTG